MFKTKAKNEADSERLNWIRLARSQNLGRVSFFKLIENFGSATLAIEQIDELNKKGWFKKPVKICPKQKAQEEIENCQKVNSQIICFFDSLYPKLLKEIYDPPPIITIKGNSELLNYPTLAIVGPRNASINGCKFARTIAEQLGLNKIIVASGLARGIDRAAHIGALKGGTIGVIAGGIDNIYPVENKDLYQKIIEENGLIISENSFGALPKAPSFPQRNRIISGLSLGVLVVEATLKSGTLITAKFASEQNREIFAVPGSPLDPRSQGTNLLIKQGAKLVENIDDILEELHITERRFSQSVFESDLEKKDLSPLKSNKDNKNFECSLVESQNKQEISKIERLILEKLNYSGTTIDEIISDLQISAKTANICLFQLEIANKIKNNNGKFFPI